MEEAQVWARHRAERTPASQHMDRSRDTPSALARSADAKPFFIAVGFVRPHLPNDAGGSVAAIPKELDEMRDGQRVYTAACGRRT